MQPKKGSSQIGATTIVHKLGAQANFDPLAFAKNNAAFSQHLKNESLKQVISAQQASFGAIAFNARTGMKPIKWIGTQRSVYTHRKNQKRIKELIAKAKTAR